LKESVASALLWNAVPEDLAFAANALSADESSIFGFDAAVVPDEDPHELDLATESEDLLDDPQLDPPDFEAPEEAPQLELDFGAIAGDDFPDDPDEIEGDFELPQELERDTPEERDPLPKLLPPLDPPQLPPLLDAAAANTSADIKRETSKNADTNFFISNLHF
jgi:hypothetical protein